MGNGNTDKKVTLTGYVAPAGWDEDDQVTAVSIQTDETEFFVEMDAQAKELLDFLNEDIEVTGIVKKNRDGTHHITIMDYILLEDDYDDDEEFLDENDWDEDEMDDEEEDDDDDYKPRMQ